MKNIEKIVLIDAFLKYGSGFEGKWLIDIHGDGIVRGRVENSFHDAYFYIEKVMRECEGRKS